MPSRFQEMLRNQRQNPETSRAGLKWEQYEDDQMLSLLSEGQSHADIAKALQRTEGSIKTRLIIYAIDKMETDKLSLDQVAEMVQLATSDILEYQERKQAREERLRKKASDKSDRVERPDRADRSTRQKQRSDRPANVTNADIYDLLMSMNKSLDTLIRRK